MKYKYSHNNVNAKRVLVILIPTTIFVTIVLIIIWISQVNKLPGFSDYNQNLLSHYAENVDVDLQFNNDKYEEITQVATKYSTLYKKDNNRIMYVSSIPIRYIDDEKLFSINRKISNKDAEYSTQNDRYSILYKTNTINMSNDKDNISVYFSDNHDDLSVDKLSDSKVEYKANNGKYICESIYNGLSIEFFPKDTMEKYIIPISIEKYRINNSNAGYVVISKLNSDPQKILQDNIFLITRPIIKTKSMMLLEGRSRIIKNKGKYYIELSFNKTNTAKKITSISFSIKLYCDNMFFDCAAYQEDPYNNYIFDDYCRLSAETNRNSCYYIKFNIRSFTPKNSSMLEKFLLCVYSYYCENDCIIEVYSVEYDWCAWELTWKNRPVSNSKIGEFVVDKKGWYFIDLTSYIKFLIDQDYFKLENNSIMLKPKNGSNGVTIISSSDNYTFPTFVKVEYRVK